ncbi:MAG: insulinase family protein, partial [Phycisphaerae bacterium]|nr:insulinase family protein [Phycisphaerae bacterium]
MSEKNILIHQLANGMNLIVEPMAEVSSAAFSFLTTAGVAYDPEGRTGTAGVLSEWLFRGAGEMNNRELNEQLDGLGLHRQSSINSIHSSFSGAIIADKLLRALEIHADVLQRPHLADDQFETCKMLSIQSLDSLEDDP